MPFEPFGLCVMAQGPIHYMFVRTIRLKKSQLAKLGIF